MKDQQSYFLIETRGRAKCAGVAGPIINGLTIYPQPECERSNNVIVEIDIDCAVERMRLYLRSAELYTRMTVAGAHAALDGGRVGDHISHFITRFCRDLRFTRAELIYRCLGTSPVLQRLRPEVEAYYLAAKEFGETVKLYNRWGR